MTVITVIEKKLKDLIKYLICCLNVAIKFTNFIALYFVQHSKKRVEGTKKSSWRRFPGRR